jgi:hypothetical protein
VGAWQVREKAVCCDAVGDDVTIIAHKDWSTNRVTVTETNWWHSLSAVFMPVSLAHRWQMVKAYYRLWPFSH